MIVLILVARSAKTANGLTALANAILATKPNTQLGRLCAWRDREFGLETLRVLTGWMREVISAPNSGTDRRYVALVDEVDLALLSPVGRNRWETVVALLILAFPEVHWIFSNTRNTSTYRIETGKEGRPYAEFLGPESLDRISFNPIFDGLGLRAFVRSRANQMLASDIAREEARDPLLARSLLATVLDEEEDYAYFHSYAAYRFGFRAIALENLAEAEAALGEKEPLLRMEMTLEDLYLAYPDKPTEYKLSHLAQSPTTAERYRSDILPALRSSRRRIFITTAHTRDVDPPTWAENMTELAAWRQEDPERIYRFVRKPTRGLFDLKRAAGLKNLPIRSGFLSAEARNSAQRHSAPGQLKQVASCLLERARQYAKDAKGVPALLHSALLAREALELLAYRTPTMAAEALALSHEMEVRAECEFVGVQHHFLVEPRLAELKAEASAMSLWAEPSMRRVVAWNIQASILTRIVRVFKEYGQFDEEQECLVRLRFLNRKLYLQEKAWARPTEPLLIYLEYLLRSLPHFFFGIVFWLMGLTAVFFATNLSISKISVAFWVAFATFFSVQPPAENMTLVASPQWLVGITMLAGFLHLGVFVSHLYSIIARR